MSLGLTYEFCYFYPWELISESQFTLCENENGNTSFAELLQRVNETACESSLAHGNHATICGDRCHGSHSLEAKIYTVALPPHGLLD